MNEKEMTADELIRYYENPGEVAGEAIKTITNKSIGYETIPCSLCGKKHEAMVIEGGIQMINVSERTCDECAHYSVCCYKNDFTNICEAVANASVHDIVNAVVINCRYFREEATTPNCLTSTTTY